MLPFNDLALQSPIDLDKSLLPCLSDCYNTYVCFLNGKMNLLYKCLFYARYPPHLDHIVILKYWAKALLPFSLIVTSLYPWWRFIQPCVCA